MGALPRGAGKGATRRQALTRRAPAAPGGRPTASTSSQAAQSTPAENRRPRHVCLCRPRGGARDGWAKARAPGLGYGALALKAPVGPSMKGDPEPTDTAAGRRHRNLTHPHTTSCTRKATETTQDTRVMKQIKRADERGTPHWPGTARSANRRRATMRITYSPWYNA